jgi:hypothetical protein
MERARKAEAEVERLHKALTDLCEVVEAHWPFPLTAEARKVLGHD